MLLLQSEIHLSYAQSLTQNDFSTQRIIEDNKLNDLVIIPNITNNELTIKSNDQIAPKYAIYSLSGQCVLKGVKNIDSETTIDLSWLKKGIYILEIQYKRKLRRKKIVKR